MSTVHTFCGKVEAVLPTLEPNSFDAGLCDSPYGIDFLGQKWDEAVPPSAVWADICRVMKPGAFLLSFGGTRMWHRLAVAIEDGGLPIADTLMWLHAQGFPKVASISTHIDKANGMPPRGHEFAAVGKYDPKTGTRMPPNRHVGPHRPTTHTALVWDGYRPGLKPAWEPIILAQKPREGNSANNITRWECGGLNIGGCRIGQDVVVSHDAPSGTFAGGPRKRGSSRNYHAKTGRYPANVILDEHTAAMLDAQAGRPVSRFFFCPKATRKERDAGLGGDPNTHPTVKPLALTEWLARLLLPPQRATPRRLLVPYSGVFSEVIGAVQAGWDEIIGIEMNAEYCSMGKARLLYHCKAG